jgi:hypothetical protein
VSGAVGDENSIVECRMIGMVVKLGRKNSSQPKVAT